MEPEIVDRTRTNGARPPAPFAFEPRTLVELVFYFWQAKVLMCAVGLGIFDALSDKPADLETITRLTGLHPRGAPDFLDSLVAMGLLTRSCGVYAHSELSRLYLDRNRSTYLGGLMEFADARLYPVWGKLHDALLTGKPQNEAKDEPDYYQNLTGHSARLKSFLEGMSGLSMDAAERLSSCIDWKRYRTFADLGGAQGALAMQLVLDHPGLRGVSYDLPAVEPLFEERRKQLGCDDRVRFIAGNFFTDSFPVADVLIMGHVLHNWSLQEKQLLIRKAYDALPPQGVLLIYDAMIDDERERGTFALLMSLNMLLVTANGSTYTAADCLGWTKAAGFPASVARPLTPTASLVAAVKQDGGCAAAAVGLHI